MRDLSSILLSIVLLGCASCSVTSSATEGTSDSVEHTTGASTDLAEASTEVTSSTSTDGDSEDEGAGGKEQDSEAMKKEEARIFAERNLAKLERDMALGSGEYLAALAEILEVEKDKQAGFFQMAKLSYSEIGTERATADTLVEILYHISKSLPS